MKRIIIAGLLLSVPLLAAANPSFKHERYVGCDSEETLGEFVRAAVAQDTNNMATLFSEKHCMELPVDKRVTYSVLDYGTGHSKIKLHFKKYSVVLWVVSEAIN